VDKRSEDWILALDQGGHATRALVFAQDGRELTRVEVPVTTRRPQAGWVEHDPAAMLDSVSLCLQRIADRLGPDTQRLAAASLATQRSSVVCWSRLGGSALSPVLSWQDVRGAGALAAMALDAAEVGAITGLRISPHYGASKLRWCLDRLPAVQAAERRGELAAGPLASWLVFVLSGGRCFGVDPCNASRTLLWDVRSRDWSPRLLEAFAVPRSLLPICRPNRWAWTDLCLGERSLPLSVVTGDQSAVPYAFESFVAGDAFLTLGTGAFLQQIEGDAPTRCPGLLNSVIRQDAGIVEYALEGTMNGAGAALTWLAESEAIAESELLAALPEWLATVREPPLFVNAIGGLAAPFWKPAARSVFVGESDLAGRAVAVVESIVFLVQANLDAMRKVGRPVRRLIAVGGLARLDGLLERIASLAGVPVHRPTQTEATAYGAARLACGHLPPLALGPCFLPDDSLKAALEARYLRCLERWRAL
jgi:glycerol kinase